MHMSMIDTAPAAATRTASVLEANARAEALGQMTTSRIEGDDDILIQFGRDLTECQVVFSGHQKHVASGQGTA
jgi:hypothetical protein